MPPTTWQYPRCDGAVFSAESSRPNGHPTRAAVQAALAVNLLTAVRLNRRPRSAPPA